MSDDQVNVKYLYLLAGIWTLFWLGTTVVDPVLPLQILSVGASEVEVGAIVSLLSVTSLVLTIPLTLLTPRVGIHWVILLSVGCRLLALALYALTPSLAWFYPARILDAIGFALLAPVLISEVSRHSRVVSVGGTMGRFLTSYALASVLGPVICGVLVEYLTYSQVITAASFFLLLIPLLLGEVRRNSSIKRLSDGSSGQRNRESLHALRRIVRSRNLTTLILTEIAFTIGRGFILAFFTIYVTTDLGLSPSTSAFAFAVLGLSNLFSRVPSGMLCDRVGRRKPFLAAFATLAVAFFLIAKAPSTPLLLLSMGLIGAGWGMIVVINWTILISSVEKHRKLAAAYYSSAFDAGGAIGAVCSGFLAAAFSFSDIFLVGSGLMLLVPIALLLLRNWPASSDKRISA